MPLNRDESAKITEAVLKLSTLPECTVTVTSVEEAYTRFANNGITTAALSLEHSVNVTAVRDGPAGPSSTNDLDEAALRAVVRRAEELAAIAPPNPERQPAL